MPPLTKIFYYVKEFSNLKKQFCKEESVNATIAQKAIDFIYLHYISNSFQTINEAINNIKEDPSILDSLNIIELSTDDKLELIRKIDEKFPFFLTSDGKLCFLKQESSI